MSRKIARRRPAVWLGGLLLLGSTGMAAAADPEIRIEPSTVYFGAAPSPSTAAAAAVAGRKSQAPAATSSAVWDSLREKAGEKGRVRVIVRLSTAFSPEGRLSSAAEVRQQREEIRAAQESTLRKLEGTPARLHGRFEYIPFLALEVDAATLEKIKAFPEVAGIEEDVQTKPTLASSNAVIGSGAAWSSGLTGDGQVVAVLDTGVDKTHPFFAGGKVVSEACYSSTSGGTTSLCPGGVAESTAPGSGVNCPAEVDGCDHGTHVAGIAAGNDGAGPDYGVGRDAGLIAIQVFSRANDYYSCYSPPCAVAWTSDLIKGLERVYELADQFDVAAVNMSLGGGLYSSRAICDFYNASTKAAIDNLRAIDVATVAASGNYGYSYYMSYPACISSAVSVGATDDADNVAGFSNVAPFMDLLAPGVAVESSVPGGGTASFNGTSMATPHVSGAWAVLKQAHPSATVSDILAILRSTAVPVSAYGISDMRRINLGKAVLAGPYVSQTFTIHNDGAGLLSVLSLELEQPVSWIKWLPEAPFDVLPGGSREVTVSIDFSRAPDGESTHRLLAGSTDADENPYPDGVYLVVNKQPCYRLTRSHTGSGGHPAPVPSSSPGCPAGQFHPGTTVQLTATPAIGWAPQSWSGTDNDASTALTNSVTMGAADRAAAVAYQIQCYALTRTHTGSGTDPEASPTNSTGCPAGQYHYAESIQLTATPAAGWRIETWTGTNNDAGRSPVKMLTMPAAAAAVSVTYLEGLISVLLVDGDGYYNTRSAYTAALDLLGEPYDVWEIDTSGNPDAATLASYPVVVWIPYPYDGLSPLQEAVAAAYLDGGGNLFLSAHEYLYNWGLTPFLSSYMGVGSYYGDAGHSQVTGQNLFSGLGPYTVSSFYSGNYYSDHVFPGPGAQTAFLADDGVSAGVSKAGPGYRTVFLGFMLPGLESQTARRDILDAALDFFLAIFEDVPRGHWAKGWVEAIYRAGVTSGCATSPRRYCPDSSVNRDQMAVFLLRAKEGAAYTPPPCTTSPFNDVPAASPFCPWIQELANRGITTGCGGGNYCPGSPVTREQMAVFLLKAKEGSGYTPAPCEVDPFSDVPYSSFSCPWIKELANRGVTAGCAPGQYCPGSSSTRAQMAVFLVKTFSLPLQ